jgi:transcriptional regulator with XRE-family HTH domain
MKLLLSENIRSLRRQRKITQAKLAEALGVTVGAVYKWESGQSLPELNLVVELADFFDISVDVLLGYRMKDNSLDCALERIVSCCKTLDPTALTEAEKMLARYPHSFRAVYVCASVYLAFGASKRDPAQLRRALELLGQSKSLLVQCDDRRISEATISGDMSIARFLLGERDESVELLRQSNAGGMFSDIIGVMLAVFMDAPEEAAPFLSEALTGGVSTLLRAIIGFAFLFRSRRDWDSAMDVLSWGIALLAGIKEGARPDYLEKAHAEMLVLLAYAQARAGMRAESDDSLQKAHDMALHFDSMPDYSVRTMRFADDTEQTAFFDVFGTTAMESIATLVGLLDDRQLAVRWSEATENE